MFKVTVMPEGREIEIAENESLLEVLKTNGLYIKSSCGGHASCGDCIIKIVEGDDFINTPSFEELSLVGNVYHITKERMSCQVKVAGDITIDIAAHDEKGDQDKRLNKKPQKIVKRTKEEAEKIIQERVEKSRAKRENQDDSWEKHWEKTTEEGTQIKKKLGGGKRPKLFRTDHLDEEKLDSDK